jgi:putative transposase
LPKEPWLKSLGIDASWPMYGCPKIIRTDNAAEFRATPMARGCEQYGITIEHRPVGRPHWGGHIERYIGTLMGRVHLLPGTTFSNSKQKGEYDSEERAVMTLGALQEWLVHEISGRYHHTVHSGIGMTPAQAWTQGFADPSPLNQGTT